MPELLKPCPLVQSTDARRWAREFMEDHFDRFNETGMYRLSQESMETWFANAIMAGYDKAKNERHQGTCGECINYNNGCLKLHHTTILDVPETFYCQLWENKND
jgi:hypothetical protein